MKNKKSLAFFSFSIDNQLRYWRLWQHNRFFVCYGFELIYNLYKSRSHLLPPLIRLSFDAIKDRKFELFSMDDFVLRKGYENIVIYTLHMATARKTLHIQVKSAFGQRLPQSRHIQMRIRSIGEALQHS